MPHANHVFPFYLRMASTQLFGQVVRCFSNNLNILYYCIKQHTVRTKIVKTFPFNKVLDMLNGYQDMLQSATISNWLSHISNIYLGLHFAPHMEAVCRPRPSPQNAPNVLSNHLSCEHTPLILCLHAHDQSQRECRRRCLPAVRHGQRSQRATLCSRAVWPSIRQWSSICRLCSSAFYFLNDGAKLRIFFQTTKKFFLRHCHFLL